MVSAATSPGRLQLTGRASRLFSFPDPVNEISARLVAGGVVVMAALTLVLGIHWGVYVLAYGFLARVLTGPSLSPLGQLATRVVTPRLGVASRPVPGPPKRFAQGIGATLTVSAAILTSIGHFTGAEVLLGMLIVAATLESVFAYCLGCKMFALLIKAGVIPQDVCERCADISIRAA
ncbi:MAG: DUF4395 domain-containing protein [Acidimicrobiales bacterium]